MLSIADKKQPSKQTGTKIRERKRAAKCVFFAKWLVRDFDTNVTRAPLMVRDVSQVRRKKVLSVQHFHEQHQPRSLSLPDSCGDSIRQIYPTVAYASFDTARVGVADKDRNVSEKTQALIRAKHSPYLRRYITVLRAYVLHHIIFSVLTLRMYALPAEGNSQLQLRLFHFLLKPEPEHGYSSRRRVRYHFDDDLLAPWKYNPGRCRRQEARNGPETW